MPLLVLVLLQTLIATPIKPKLGLGFRALEFQSDLKSWEPGQMALSNGRGPSGPRVNGGCQQIA